MDPDHEREPSSQRVHRLASFAGLCFMLTLECLMVNVDRLAIERGNAKLAGGMAYLIIVPLAVWNLLLLLNPDPRDWSEDPEEED